MKKLLLFISILLIISSCTNQEYQPSPKNENEVVADGVTEIFTKERLKEIEKEVLPKEGGEKGRSSCQYFADPDGCLPENLPDCLDWADSDNPLGRSVVTPVRYQNVPGPDMPTGFGTCGYFAAIAAVESNILLTHPSSDYSASTLDLAELAVLSRCEEENNCWENDHACDGVIERHVLDWLSQNSIPVEESDCFPYKDDIKTDYWGEDYGGYRDCYCPLCEAHWAAEDGEQVPDPYINCNTIRHSFNHAPLNSYSLASIKYHLWRYGPLVISIDFSQVNGYYGARHIMLITGYEDNYLLFKDSARYQIEEMDYYNILDEIKYIYYLEATNPPEFCENNDNDNYCWWGIQALYNNPREMPSECYYEGCTRDWRIDCFDGHSSISQCRFNSKDDCDDEFDFFDDNPCDSWESCEAQYDDCAIPSGRSEEHACAGDGVCDEEVETCENAPFDCAPCPECSDGIDNDGDGLVDFQGFMPFDQDTECDSFEDNSESTEICVCGDGDLCGGEICELGQESNVLCYNALTQGKRCFGPFGSEGSFWDKGIWKDNVCYPIFGTTTRECEDCETWNPNWDNCKICTAVEGINPGDYVERVYATDTECRQKRYSDDQWISMPFEDYTPYNPPGGWGKPKIEMTDQPPGGPLRSQEKDSFWDWIICFITGCPDDDWEPSEG